MIDGKKPVCENCGRIILESNIFCPFCGTKVPGKEVEEVPTREVAGAELNVKSILPSKEKVKEGTAEAAKKGAEVMKNAGYFLAQKAVKVKDAAVAAKDDITEKLTELDRMLESSVTEYNDAYTLMNDKGVRLYVERCRATDAINNVELLVNSIANRPKSFDTDFEQIDINREEFSSTCDYAEREIQAARAAAGGAGAGLAAGASVAFMAPTAAMWIATTFGTASTGVAISTLSGAAATNAALAWLGGGALAAGGGGIAGGNALLALAGPIGWTIAGATLLTSIILFTKNRAKLNKEKNEEIAAVKKNTERVKEIDLQINEILVQTNSLRASLAESYGNCIGFFDGDYLQFTDEQKERLGTLVNLTKSLSVMFDRKVEQEATEE